MTYLFSFLLFVAHLFLIFYSLAARFFVREKKEITFHTSIDRSMDGVFNFAHKEEGVGQYLSAGFLRIVSC